MVKVEEAFRVASYWVTVGMTIWTLSYFYVYGTEKGREWYRDDLPSKVMSDQDINGGSSSKLIGVNAPLLIAASACLLLVTATSLPRYAHTWVNYFFSCYRGGQDEKKKNQFGLGEANFNYVAIFLVVVPPFAYFMENLDRRVFGEDETGEQKLKTAADTAGLAGVLCLSFFLVPVARHSILLVAMGWSPVHALRIHVWAGFASFFWIMLHGILYICVLFLYHDGPVIEGIIPGSDCWAWKPLQELSESDIERGRSPHSLSSECKDQFYNFTGIIALVFFIILCVTSLNWFRRKYYRLFYIFHMTFGVAMLVTAVAHWNSLITYIMPSVVYYLASTAPVLIQAVASRFRGGVQIKKVVHLKDAGGVKEVQIATTMAANAALDNQPSMFVKLCVPSISLVWHPFTVFKNNSDPTTVRFLFRPVGPFTKKLAAGLEQDCPPVTIMDGFYQTGNRCLEALQHDHVTIICGGVAITPFLSMIPSVLKAVSSKLSSRSVRTKKLVLHWACREHGLMKYVVENYLMSMKCAADLIKFDLEIILHQTGGKINSLDVDESKKLSDELQEMTQELSFRTEPTEDFLDELKEGATVKSTSSSEPSAPSSQDSSSASSVNEKGEASSTHEESDSHTSSSGNKNEEEAEPPAEQESLGHSMELGRFMPGKDKKMWQNIPAFLAIGGSIWLYFFIIWYYYEVHEFTAHENLTRIWSLVVCLLSAIGLGIFFEGSALVAARRKLLTNPSLKKTFETSEYNPEEELVEEGTPTLNFRIGRPNFEEVFQESNENEYPAIFMCGPMAMTDMVKNEAQKHNSLFGFTGICIYEEPFEM
ncbi:hypothetical protein ACA910_015749 [Epithemia clementina (nom. ined.)]